MPGVMLLSCAMLPEVKGFVGGLSARVRRPKLGQQLCCLSRLYVELALTRRLFKARGCLGGAGSSHIAVRVSNFGCVGRGICIAASVKGDS